MKPRDWTIYIDDILEAVARIRRYLDGKSFDEFCQDELTHDAVLRNITIIGEAARNIPDEVADRYPDIPWPEMRGMRNAVVHGYAAVDLSIVWDTTQADLPRLVLALQSMLTDD